MDDVFSAEMQTLSARALQRLRAAGCAITDEAALARLAVASDLAIDALVRQPELLDRLQTDAAAPLPAPMLEADNQGEWARLLRRYRQAESTRLVWRDVVECADVEEVLAGSSALAETCQIGRAHV